MNVLEMLPTISTAEFPKVSVTIIEHDLLRLRQSQFLSAMADIPTDVASREEMSICSRWIEGGKASEHFVRVHEVNAQSLAQYSLDFLCDRSIDIKQCLELDHDLQVKLHAPSALYVHCHCRQLQLASVHAADKHSEVNEECLQC